MKHKLVLITLVTGLLFTGCSDDEGPYVCSSCVDEPEANALYDNTGQGIYKGVVVGSSGTIRFDIANSNSSITAVLNIDNETIDLVAEGIYNGGFEGTFYGTLNAEDDVSIVFYVSGNGFVEIYDVTIPGHSNVVVSVAKERSTQLVEVFEGTFSGADSGTFNLVVLRDDLGFGEWFAVARSDGDTFFEGIVEENEMFGGGGDIIVVGSIKGDRGDNVSGEWEHDAGGTGTWKGKRTL